MKMSCDESGIVEQRTMFGKEKMNSHMLDFR